MLKLLISERLTFICMARPPGRLSLVNFHSVCFFCEPEPSLTGMCRVMHAQQACWTACQALGSCEATSQQSFEAKFCDTGAIYQSSKDSTWHPTVGSGRKHNTVCCQGCHHRPKQVCSLHRQITKCMHPPSSTCCPRMLPYHLPSV